MPFDRALLEDTKLKIERANRDVANVLREIDSFIGMNPYLSFEEVDPQTGEQVTKARLARTFPDEIASDTVDAINKLRSALDLMCVALARGNGHTVVNDVYFPFAKTRNEFESKGTQKKIKRLPDAAKARIHALKPYGGSDGNPLLYAINLIRQLDQHRLIVRGGIGKRDVTISNMTLHGGLIIGATPKWMPFDDGIELFRVAPGSEIKKYPQIEIAIDIAFGKIEGVEGQSIVGTLHQMRDLVQGIVSTFENTFFA